MADRTWGDPSNPRRDPTDSDIVAGENSTGTGNFIWDFGRLKTFLNNTIFPSKTEVTAEIAAHNTANDAHGSVQANFAVHDGAGGAAHADAVAAGAAGFMTGSDKSKLDGVEAGANAYSHPDHSGEVTSTGDGAQVITAGAVTTVKLDDGAVTRAKEANMGANTIRMRVTTGGVPTDSTIAGLADHPTPAGGDKFLAQKSGGDLVSIDVGNLPAGGENNTQTNQGTGAQIGLPKSGIDLPIRTLESTDASITFTATATTLDLSATGAGGGQANTQTNIGGGVELGLPKNGVDLPIRTLEPTQFELNGNQVRIPSSVFAPAAHVGAGNGAHALFNASSAGFVDSPGAGSGTRILREDNAWIELPSGPVTGGERTWAGTGIGTPPASGTWRSDTSNLGTVTAARFHNVDLAGRDGGTVLADLKAGARIFLQLETDPAQYGLYLLNSDAVDNGTDVTLPTLVAEDNSGSTIIGSNYTLSAVWSGAGGGIPDIATADGDLISYDGTTYTKLPVGGDGQVLTARPGAGQGLKLAYETPAGGGDMLAPATTAADELYAAVDASGTQTKRTNILYTDIAVKTAPQTMVSALTIAGPASSELRLDAPAGINRTYVGWDLTNHTVITGAAGSGVISVRDDGPVWIGAPAATSGSVGDLTASGVVIAEGGLLELLDSLYVPPLSPRRSAAIVGDHGYSVDSPTEEAISGAPNNRTFEPQDGNFRSVTTATTATLTLQDQTTDGQVTIRVGVNVTVSLGNYQIVTGNTDPGPGGDRLMTLSRITTAGGSMYRATFH